MVSAQGTNLDCLAKQIIVIYKLQPLLDMTRYVDYLLWFYAFEVVSPFERLFLSRRWKIAFKSIYASPMFLSYTLPVLNISKRRQKFYRAM